MKNISIFTFCSILFLNACKEFGPQPPSMVGTFEVSGKLKDGTIDTDEISNSVSDAMNEVKTEMQKARREIDQEFDLANIDTTTAEGKIEYAAKKFGKSMSDLGLSMGEMGKDLGNIFGGLAEDGMGLAQSILKNINAEIELQADGDVKAKNSLINISLPNASWQVDGDQFILFTDHKAQSDTFLISNKSTEGFILSKDELELHFVKKNPQ
jgi:hypothetical protein